MRSKHLDGKLHAKQQLRHVAQRHAEFAESAKREQSIQANLRVA